MAKGARVAVVDDDASVRRALERLLRASAYDAHSYGSGPDFVASLRSERPDCLVVDLQMPGMSGLELHTRLVEARIRIPTIIITAHDEGGLRERCIAAGVAGYLLKPLKQFDITAAINAAIGTSNPKDASSQSRRSLD